MPKNRQATGQVVDALRTAITDSGKNHSELARMTGIDHGQLSRFMRNERSLSLAAVSKLAELFGLCLQHPHMPAQPTNQPTPHTEASIENFCAALGDIGREQRTVLISLLQGKEQSVIAQDLGCKTEDVRALVASIMRTLGGELLSTKAVPERIDQINS